ncbi:MAG: hypothetical protein IT574_11030 [Candidatus Aureabacteria bacterium]|nr:hypothetical protein [Candidatus Auribacterota bacterium]NLW93684.1 outer membrane protein assembly factor BamE [Chlamydiota bacterium]HOE26303.1 hypothetical protein [bacterium]HQM51845.1 hypothetical protein [bacterium]
MRGFKPAACVAAAFLCGCAGVDTGRLRDGMTRAQVRAAAGSPAEVFVAKGPGSGVEVWVYRARYFPGIPNPLNDYDYLVPPLVGAETRVRFVHGRLRLREPLARDRARPSPPVSQTAGVPLIDENGEFRFYGIAFGMTKDEIQEAVSRISPAKMRRSRGGEWGEYQVLNLSGKMLGLYFSFDDRGRLWWMKAEYPYSRTDSGKTAALLQALKERCQAPVARSHPDVELVLDEARMRMTMVSKPLRDEYRARVPEEQRR